MIYEELMELIRENMKLHLLKSDWKYIDYMMGEMYLMNYEGQSVIVVKPLPDAFATMQFSALNGAFMGDVINWEEIKSTGKPI